ncbi:hypothetical protein CASFOL_010154 [Castilleja foliolosa]|uniref:Uncharacterized protein n=1 Tax=Castilleja foliolosa TaxID=1961234 RepID=A0ABD3DVG5_9LAMI
MPILNGARPLRRWPHSGYVPPLLTADPYIDVYLIFDFLLHTVQLPFHEVRKSLIRCPRIPVSEPETQLRPTFQFLTELGFVGQSKLTSQTTLLLVSSVETTLMPKIVYLTELGFEYDDVRNMYF